MAELVESKAAIVITINPISPKKGLALSANAKSLDFAISSSERFPTVTIDTTTYNPITNRTEV